MSEWLSFYLGAGLIAALVSGYVLNVPLRDDTPRWARYAVPVLMLVLWFPAVVGTIIFGRGK